LQKHFDFCPIPLPMKLSVFVGLALCAPLFAIRKGKRKHAIASVDCGALADLEVGGKQWGETLEKVCQSWPPSMGEFPVSDIGRARDLLGKVMDEGGAWDQIKQIRSDREDRGFCWRNNTLRSGSGGECPLGYKSAGLRGLFDRSCNTGCMWSTHPVSCGFGCATDRDQCASNIVDQSFIVAQGVSSVYGFVTGDVLIGKAVSAIITLAEFLLQALPPIVDVINGAIDILKNNEDGAMVAVILFKYLQDTAGDVREPAEAIRDAIQQFGAIIAQLTEEKRETGGINPRSIIRLILDEGPTMLDLL